MFEENERRGNFHFTMSNLKQLGRSNLWKQRREMPSDPGRPVSNCSKYISSGTMQCEEGGSHESAFKQRKQVYA